MPDLKMLNSTKYLYKLTFIKCSYERLMTVRQIIALVLTKGTTGQPFFLWL